MILHFGAIIKTTKLQRCNNFPPINSKIARLPPVPMEHTLPGQHLKDFRTRLGGILSFLFSQIPSA